VDRSIYGVFTLGGLDTRATGEVLDARGCVVEGLYAAGRNSAGLPREGRTYASGMSIGGASFFGRLAGRQAARPIPEDASVTTTAALAAGPARD
jgi:predicted oxidoreductase